MTAPTLPGGQFRPARVFDPAERGTDTRGRIIAWVLVRVTGVLLSFLVLGHFGMTHILTDVADTGPNFIARRWASAIWLIWDWLLLASALLHGASGVWVAISDYAMAAETRRRWQRALLALTAVIFAIGSVAVVSVGSR